jgi:GTP 3',8-cyclase
MLRDSYGREVTYLRVSVTERCNFRCQYCMPEKPFDWIPRENLLSYEELFGFIKIGIDNGIRKIRITGGEPTVRDDLHLFIKMITDYAPDIDIAMTTNGYLLAPLAEKLKAAGLKRINISLDSLQKETLHYITKKDVYDKVIAGIDAALRAGMKVKLNAVILRDVNEDEVIPLFDYAKKNGMQIRYIEYMENSFANQHVRGLRSDEVLDILRTHCDFVPAGDAADGPATLYETRDGYRFGTIEPHKHDFCATCNRIRLTAEGDLIPCLYFDEAMSIRDAMRRDDAGLAEAVLKAVVRNKPEKNRWNVHDNEVSSRAFYQTGG